MEATEALELPDGDQWTLVDLLARAAERFGEAAFEFELGGRITFASLDERSDGVAAGLAELGVSQGDRVFALVRNRLEFMVALFATAKLGAIWVPVNTELKGAFLEHQLQNSDPKLVLLDTALAGAFEGVTLLSENELCAVIQIDDPDIDAPLVSIGGRQAQRFEVLEGHHPRIERANVTPADIALIMYTSGTTGPAKGVLMPHAHCYLFAAGLTRALDLGPTDHYFICMPLFHANALLMQAMSCLLSGASAHVVVRFSPNRWLDDVRHTGATHSNLLGVMPEFIWNTERTDHDHVHQLQAIMAAPVGQEWAEGFVARFGVDLIQGFGMTECNIPFYTNPDDPPLPGLAGRLLDDWFEARVVDPETDEPRLQGEVGEIVVRPKVPNGFMAGYFQMPEKTVEAWRNLWFHTGDAGRLDAEGRMFFIDRIKDCIRRRGENISAFEVEQVLNTHPHIEESVVVGVKVAGAGGEEEVKACIRSRGGADIDFVALLNYCAERMPRFAVPRFVELVREIPRTGTGKVQKQAFRDAGVTAATWDRDSVGYIVPRS